MRPAARTAAALVLGAGAVLAQTPPLTVVHHARAVHPGEVVILEVRSSRALAHVRATAFGATVRFFPAARGVWHGLAGIDLDTRPDSYPVVVEAAGGDGATLRTTYTLEVEPKEFPTRHLTVEPRYVEPPADVLDRILRESARQAGIFETVTALRQWRGGFLRPVPGQATSSFGRRSVFNGQPRRPHSGTDFRAAAGTAIRAPNAGTVVLAENLYFSGNAVILDHGWGLYSYFAHLSAIAVTEGEAVQPGQVVGEVGATGRVTGPHLHWTVRLNNARVDPLALLALLPPE